MLLFNNTLKNCYLNLKKTDIMIDLRILSILMKEQQIQEISNCYKLMPKSNF